MNRLITAITWAITCWAVGISLSGAEVSPTASPYTLVRVSLVQGEAAAVLSRDFVPISFATTASGIVWTGPPGRYVVVVSGGSVGLQLLTVEITGTVPIPPTPVPPTPIPPTPIPPTPIPPGPTPPTPPGPIPPDPQDGVATRLYPLIVAVNDKPTAAKMAANYRLVLNDMNAGIIKSVMVARTKLSSLNNGMTLPIIWKPAIDGMVKELNGVFDIPTLKKVFSGTIAALEQAAR